MGGRSYAVYAAVRVACPFYKGEDACDVRCEGVERGGALVNHFGSEKRKEAYMRVYCHEVKGCEGCPIHGMLVRVCAGSG